MWGYQPFLMEGLVSVDAQSTDQVKVTMLRDTGAMQTIVTKDAFPFSDQTFAVAMFWYVVLGWKLLEFPCIRFICGQSYTQEWLRSEYEKVCQCVG